MMHVVARRRFSPHGAVVEFVCGTSTTIPEDDQAPIVGDGTMCDACLEASETAGVTVAA